MEHTALPDIGKYRHEVEYEKIEWVLQSII